MNTLHGQHGTTTETGRKDTDEACPRPSNLNGIWLGAPDTASSNIPLDNTYKTEYSKNSYAYNPKEEKT